MRKHTPGPWSLETVKTCIGICHKIGSFPSRGRYETTYACVYADGVSFGREDGNPIAEELRANAHLIAAAPDFYSAVCEGKPSVRDKIAEEIRRGGGIFSDAELAAIDAAIAKAEGGAE